MLIYSLGPIPWSLTTVDGRLGKTVKSNLLELVECAGTDPLVANIPDSCVRVFDGMVLIQQLVSTKFGTFGEMSEFLLKRITSNQAKVIYLVTDQYKEDSLKRSERQRQAAAGSIRMQLTRNR